MDPRVVAIALADHRAAAKAQRPSRYGVAAQKQAIHVRAPVPNRTSTVGDGVALMYGCYDQKKNVCRHHKLQEHQRGPFENIVDLFKAWANSLEPPQQKSCAELIALIGSDGADDPNTIMLVELLIVCKLSPKMQFFGNCSVVGEDGAALARDGPVADAFPFTVDVRGRTPRLSCGVADYDLQAVCSSTSDELALYMIGKKIDWELVPLSYTIDVGHPSLGRMIVHARGEAFSRPEPRRRAKQTVAIGLPAEFELGDPTAHGKVAAHCSSFGHGGGRGEASAAVEDGVASGDMFDAAFLAHGVDLADGVGPDTAPGAEEEVGDDIFACVAETGGEEEREREPSEASELPAVSATDFVAAAVVDEHGYVSCPMAPFDTRRCVGRLTIYPASAPIGAQNVAMKCYLHDGCSVLRKRVKVSDERMIRWLLTGVPIAAENRHDAVAIQRAHRVAAVAML